MKSTHSPEPYRTLDETWHSAEMRETNKNGFKDPGGKAKKEVKKCLLIIQENQSKKLN